MDSLKIISRFSIIAFIILELGFWLKGYSKLFLIVAAAIIMLSMLIVVYGYFEKLKKNKKKFEIGLLIILLPLVSIFFNPTKYLYQIEESTIILRAYCDGSTFGPSGDIILTKAGKCYWITNNLLMQKVEKADYEIINNVVSIYFEDETHKMNLRVKDNSTFLCAINVIDPDYYKCFQIEKNELGLSQ